MSVEALKASQDLNTANGYDTDGDVVKATKYAAEHFDKLMQSDSGHDGSDASLLAEQLQQLDKLLMQHSPFVNNTEAIRSLANSIVQSLSDSGALDIEQLPSAGNEPSIKSLTDSIRIDTKTGDFLVRVPASNGDGSDNFKPLAQVSGSHVVDAAQALSSFAWTQKLQAPADGALNSVATGFQTPLAELQGIAANANVDQNSTNQTTQSSQVAATVEAKETKHGNSGSNSGSTSGSTSAAAFASSSTAPIEENEQGNPVSGGSTGTGITASTPAAADEQNEPGESAAGDIPDELRVLLKELVNVELSPEALEADENLQLTYTQAANRAQRLWESVKDGSGSKDEMNDFAHALQQMANIRLGLPAHAGNRHELARLVDIANGVPPRIDSDGGFRGRALDDASLSEIEANVRQQEAAIASDPWLNLNQKERDNAVAHSLGMDARVWSEDIKPLLEQSRQFHEIREDMSFDIGDAAQIVVAAAVTYMTAGAATALGASMTGSAFAGGFAGSLAGGSDFEGALTGGVIGAATAGLGNVGGGYSESLQQVGMNDVRTFSQNAAIRGGIAELQGGDFEDGIVSELGHAVTGVTGAGDSYPVNLSNWTGDTVRQFAQNVVVQGTVSEINGGDFEDGLANEAGTVIGNNVATALGNQGVPSYLANATGRTVTSAIRNGADPYAATQAAINSLLHDHDVSVKENAIHDSANDFGADVTRHVVNDTASGDDDVAGNEIYDPAYDFGSSADSTSDHADAPRYSPDDQGNMINLDTLEMFPAMASNTNDVVAGDEGSIRPLASYGSTMQAIYNSDLSMSEKFDMMVENTSFYLAASSDALRSNVQEQEKLDQEFYLNGDAEDPFLNRAAAVFNRAGYNLLHGGADAYSIFVNPVFRSEAGAALHQMVSDPSATTAAIGDSLSNFGDLPWDEQIEVAAEFSVTALVSGGPALPRSLARSVDAMGEAGNATQATLRARLTNRAVETTDNVFIPLPRAPGITLYANVPVQTLDSGVISIARLNGNRVAEIDRNSYINPLTNERVSFEAGDKVSIDHIVPVHEIVRLDGFRQLTRQQMENLIQDSSREFGNLQALPLSINSSKRNHVDGGWKTFRDEPLHVDYREWLDDQQIGIMEAMRVKIDTYIDINQSGG